VLLVSLGERGEFGVTRSAKRCAARPRAEGPRREGAGCFIATCGRRPRPALGRAQPVLGIREAFYRFDQLKTQKKPPRRARRVTLRSPARPSRCRRRPR
jgi:hypothetical protein